MPTIVQHTTDHRGMKSSICPRCKTLHAYWEAEDLDENGNLLCYCDAACPSRCPHKTIDELATMASQRAASGDNYHTIVHEIVEGYNLGWQSANNRLIEEAAKNPMPKQFDGYEIRKVAEYDDGKGGTFCEPIDDHEDDDLRTAVAQALTAKRTFWTLYGHTQGEGVQDIADRDTYEEIRDLYQRITGRYLTTEEGRRFRNQ